MDKTWVGQERYDVTQPGLAAYKQIWKIHQDPVYWVNIGPAQHIGLTFFQTRSNAIILHDTLPASCIERVVSRKSEDILNTKTKSPRPAPTFTLKVNWRKVLDSRAPEGTETPLVLRSLASSSEQPSKPSRVESTGIPVALDSLTGFTHPGITSF